MNFINGNATSFFLVGSSKGVATILNIKKTDMPKELKHTVFENGTDTVLLQPDDSIKFMQLKATDIPNEYELIGESLRIVQGHSLSWYL